MMIIVLSPAKTFKSDLIDYVRYPYFEKEASMLIEKLKHIDIEDLMKTMHISKKIALDVNHMCHTYGENRHRAIFTYDGAAYKAFNILSLDSSLYPLVDKRLYILSGLYGIVKPFDTISHYRLEMQYKHLGSLYMFWENKVRTYFEEKHNQETIICLASEEYRKILSSTLNVYNIVFKVYNGKTYQSPSMMVKKMRGLMARKIIENQIDNLEDLKKINIDDFIFDKNRSTTREFVFIKHTKNDLP
jgi:uncharacterized protein